MGTNSRKYCIGIDLGGTFIKFALMDSDRRVGETFQLPTPTDRGCAGVAEQIICGAKEIISSGGLSRDDVLGVGIGSPGPINISEGVIMAMPNISGMDNCPLRDMVSDGLDLPAVLENDANVAALGEYLCGAGEGTGEMVMLTLGTGVGSGIIIGGKILHGSHEIGGEIGHMIVQPGGEQCGCGQRGCLEQYASATYMARRATRLIEQDGRDSSLKQILAETGSIDSKDIQQARSAGDALAGEVWDSSAYYLALACINICRIFDPDEIVLAGGLTKAADDLLEPVRGYFESLHWKLTERFTTIVIAQLGNDAGTIGAAGVAWQSFGAND